LGVLASEFGVDYKNISRLAGECHALDFKNSAVKTFAMLSAFEFKNIMKLPSKMASISGFYSKLLS